MGKSNYLIKLKQLFNLLVENDVHNISKFSEDKSAILKVFSITKDNVKADVLTRLTLIDSMYSTQMSRRYYALDELADALIDIDRTQNLRTLFISFTKDPQKYADYFNYENGKNLFSECYGIGKDGKSKGVAVSLISKYAYFLTEFKFPIYDSIACEMYPLVWRRCGFAIPVPKLIIKDVNGRVLGKQTMVTYIQAINTLIKQFECKNLNYDLLDRYLWFVGKIRRGNLSLILSREEYEYTINMSESKNITTINKNGKEKTKTIYFNIDHIDIGKLEYLKNNPILKSFFELAKVT